tara:strand:+ start:22 stop:735 length:714 start_codon:yes stop_codon:yes gene_type:complete
MATWQDPVLARTSWTPLARNGHAWRTHRLVVHEAEGWAELRPNLPHNRPLLIVSECTGLTLMIWQIARDAMSSSDVVTTGWLAWLTILLIAMPVFALTLRTVVFDYRSGRFWEQRMAWRARPKGSPPAPPSRSAAIGGRLTGIHAVQLLTESISTAGAFAPQGVPQLRHRWFYNSYELNLVNHRGGRLNLIDHADLSGLRRDADQLAWFLNVPFWDGVDEQGATMTDLKMDVLRNIR